MHLSSIQVLLLAAVAITSIPRSALGQAAPKTCADADLTKQFCSNCKTTSRCEVTGSAPVPKTVCATGEACKVLLGKYAVCKPIAETPCACGTKPTKCDPYDPDSLLVCLSGGITTNQTCQVSASPNGTCIDDKCGTAAPKPTTPSLTDLCLNAEDGFVAVTPECKTAVYCQDKASIGPTDPCPAGQYYDVDELQCLPSPPLPCPVSCGTGACNDKSNCSRWYICDVGTVLDEETCDGETPEFDMITSECVAEGNGTCSKNTGCNFNLPTTPSSSTTTTPTTSSTTSTRTTTTPPTTTNTARPTTTSTRPPTTSSTTTSTRTSTTPPTSSSTTTSTSSTTSTTRTSTVRPPTCGAANVGLRYAIAGNCKMYSSCRLVGTNVYAYVDSTCLGSNVFNPKTGYCDTVANVPGCAPV